MGYEKPMTPNQKYWGNTLYKYMMKNNILTKEQMLEYLGWDSNKDRQLRELISLIAQKVPVVSTSDTKGYKIAKTKADLEAVEHQKAEILSRINELKARLYPLDKFLQEIS